MHTPYIHYVCDMPFVALLLTGPPYHWGRLTSPTLSSLHRIQQRFILKYPGQHPACQEADISDVNASLNDLMTATVCHFHCYSAA